MTQANKFQDLKYEVELQCKRTVGYHEAVNKETYLIGVHTATQRTAVILFDKIDALNAEIKRLTTVESDLKTVVGIVNKYSSDAE